MRSWAKALAGLIGLLAMVAGATLLVSVQRRDFRNQEAATERHADEVRLCRMQLGIDYDFGQRKMVMACAQDVVSDGVRKGQKRSDAASNAWDICMPEMSTCSRALGLAQ